MESQQNRATDGSAGSAVDKVKSDAADIANKVKSDTAELAQDVKRRGEQQLDSQKHAAADQAKSLAGVVERAAEDLREQDQQSLAQYAGQLADSMKSFADSLKAGAPTISSAIHRIWHEKIRRCLFSEASRSAWHCRGSSKLRATGKGGSDCSRPLNTARSRQCSSLIPVRAAAQGRRQPQGRPKAHPLPTIWIKEFDHGQTAAFSQ